MLANEVVFPGELPEDPVAMMRGLPRHRVDTTRLLIDETASSEVNTERFDTINKAGRLASLHTIKPERVIYAARSATYGLATVELAEVDLVLVH